MVSHEETKCYVVPDSHTLTGPITLAFLFSNVQQLLLLGYSNALIQIQHQLQSQAR